MMLRKPLLASLGATLLLGMLVGSTSARTLSMSSQTFSVSFSRLNFTGGFGTVECSVALGGSWHSRTLGKSVGSLVGYITSGNVSFCARGGGTILRETLPWHVRYSSFAGTLPNIVGIAFKTDTRFRIREPAFGLTCLFASTPEQQAGLTFSLVGGVIARADRSGTVSSSDCLGLQATLSGSETNVSRITVTLI
jgi:hypothetical protein